jgi:type IV pilus assembly protein PilC
MEYSYVAYTEDKKMVKGRISAANDETAINILGYGGYQVVSLKQAGTSFTTGRLAATFSRIKPQEIVMFSRQLALLLESGTDISTSFDLLQSQTTNHTLKKTLSQVATDIRGGSLLSTALAKHPRLFSKIYWKSCSGRWPTTWKNRLSLRRRSKVP